MTRTIDWPGELREAMARRGNNVRLTADDLLAWEALPHILDRVTALEAEVEWMRVEMTRDQLDELLGRARVLMAQIHDLTSWEHRHLCEVAPCQSAQWLLDAAIAAGPPADNEATR